MATSDADRTDEQRAAVAARLSGYESVEKLRRAELASMTEAEAAAIADDLLQMLPHLPPEPDRGSGLVEQQRLFSRARR